MVENLVIVEAPKKARTIEKLLGKEYVVASSIGHIRDLAKKGLGIDVNKNYELAYEIPAEKKKVVEELKSLSKKAKNIWLASDGDREGEAIAWHLTEVLGLDVNSTKRIVFHEITKSALVEAIAAPRTVNMDLVNAQQARRVLDRLVGFELSPVLWRKVRPQLSAGRVQSVAVRLLVEREREIIAFNSAPYFRVVGQFMKGGDKASQFKAELTKRFDTQSDAENFLAQCNGAAFEVSKVEDKPVKRYPAPPFTTSTMQQEAGRKLGMSVSQTMSVAQKLYEQGLITYMRTDSVNLSGQALAMCKEQIVSNYGENYSQVKNYKTKAKGAQEAHEAIRPSYIDRQSIEGTTAEKRLYDLIWKRTVASQMVAAELDRTIINIDRKGGDDKATFSATGEVLRFDGFMKLYTESTTDEDTASDGTDSGMLPRLSVGEAMDAASITATQRFTQPPARYNEAAMISKLEDLGIGRPSTMAKIFSTISDRGYSVERNTDGEAREYVQLTLSGGKVSSKVMSEKFGKERKRLAPTDIAIMVNDYLETQFSQILDYNFTADVEKEFDRIAMGEIAWDKMIDDFYKPFHNLVTTAEETQTDRSMHERILGQDPKTGRDVKARIGRYGPMVEIVSPSEDEKPKYAALKKGQLIESVTLEQALELFALPRDLGEFEGEALVVGVGRFGPYVRHGKSFTSLAKTDDPYTIGLERAIELVTTTRETKAAASVPLKTFDEEPDMLVKSGRYGPYIAFKGKNYRIPKGTKPEELTYEAAKGIVAKSKK
ncbi:MAG: type I DNA topoisomerase [Rikenellaceae bacterium]